VTARLKEISRDWQTRLKRFFEGPLEAGATPLEVCQAVLDEIESKVEPLGRGRRTFPYDRVVIRINRSTPADSARLPAAFAALPERVRERLKELQCTDRLDVKVAMLKKAPADWVADQLFAVDYHSSVRKPAVSTEVIPVQIVVLKGAATSKTYHFTEPVISIGRTTNPTDDRGHVRRNRVAFLDKVDGITETVGRAHARLRFDPKSGDYHVLDEGSSNGTAVLRGGSTIPVPPRDPRGVRVQSGDELQVGRAVVRVVVGRGP
jgi:hypothetical protein